MRKKAAAGRGGVTVAEYPKAMDIALKLLSYRRRTEREMEKRLREKGVGEELARRVCGRLKGIGYLDDRQFALDWIRSRRGARCRSVWVLKRELREKGIAPALAEEAVSEGHDGEEAFAAACVIARQRFARIGRGDPSKAKAGIQGLLLRRGFDYDFIRRVIAETSPPGRGVEMPAGGE